ncbi:DUF2017 domain-containing protein [uncultured Nocardioides sp.]|uniref:DUF2017 domain-containing protein n=1 Tax=uncultured Nocardioides sp. TaxID=198441 RepID=UPI00261D298F|nr:DUF2017 domain-containing protein [uncultured Nocardioides sp.]
MSGFAWHRRSKRVIATFSGFEADLLRSLTSQLVELLRNEQAAPTDSVDPLEAMMDFSGPTTEPEDPVLRRLFPTAYPDDEEAAGDFRRFTEGALRDTKATSASAIIDALEEAGLPPELTEDGLVIDVELDRGEAHAWMRTFTDVRLALATRLEVEEGDEERWAAMPEDDPRARAHDIYDWVGYLQETLVHALTKAA